MLLCSSRLWSPLALTSAGLKKQEMTTVLQDKLTLVELEIIGIQFLTTTCGQTFDRCCGTIVEERLETRTSPALLEVTAFPAALMRVCFYAGKAVFTERSSRRANHCLVVYLKDCVYNLPLQCVSDADDFDVSP